MKTIFEQMRTQQPQFFSGADITIAAGSMQAMADIITAIRCAKAHPITACVRTLLAWPCNRHSTALANSSSVGSG